MVANLTMPSFFLFGEASSIFIIKSMNTAKSTNPDKILHRLWRDLSTTLYGGGHVSDDNSLLPGMQRHYDWPNSLGHKILKSVEHYYLVPQTQKKPILFYFYGLVATSVFQDRAILLRNFSLSGDGSFVSWTTRARPLLKAGLVLRTLC